MRRANRLAHLLAGQGVGPGQRVALLLPRSAEAIVAMLAVLKTGAAYVPIDPAVPAARMQFVLGDAAPIAAITTAELRRRLDGHDLLVIDIEDLGDPLDSQPSTALAGAGPRRCRVHHLHLGHHRDAQGGGDPAPQRDPAAGDTGCRPGAGRGRCGRSAIRWRSTSRCGRSGVRCSTAGGWWWCPMRWCARRRTCTPCWSLSRSMC